MEKKKVMQNALLLVFAVIAVNLAAVLYIKCGKNIYFWDDATYWDIARSLAKRDMNGTFWKDVYNSVASQDYNYAAGVISSIYVRLFGESRLVYVLGLANTYLLPSYVMVYFLAKKLGKAPVITSVAAVAASPVALFLTLNGFVDIGGLFLCLLCYSLYYAKNEKRTLLNSVFIGLILVLLMVWRRWYAFFSVSFITAMAADSLLTERKKIPVLVTMATAGLFLLFGFGEFLFEKLLQNYGDLYSGYKFALSVDFKLLTRYFGILLLAVLLGGSVAAMIKKGEKRTMFMWIQMCVCFIMFVLTQTHGQQHLLLYVPSVIMLCIILTNYIPSNYAFAAAAAFAAIQTLSPCLPRTQPQSISEIKHYAVIPDFSLLPKARTDTEEILELKNKLDTVVEEGKTLGVLASSFVLNEDVFKNVQPSLGKPQTRENYIVSLPQVDSRDRDMTAFYNVNYILAAFPAQTHLAEGNQTVVTEAVKSFEAYADFAIAYEEIPEYETVIDGITVKLYKRTKTVPESAMKEFEERLYKHNSQNVYS